MPIYVRVFKMAGEHRSLERRDLKMGRSKFPGKPSRVLNRRRVNLINCDRPEHNDSSVAAENISLNYGVFNRTFGDNEQLTREPFVGFSTPEIRAAMAQARLQQREAASTYKLLSIDAKAAAYAEKLTECFDGGGKQATAQSSQVPLDKKLVYSPKSLQSRAAKRLLDKAKKVNNPETEKKKFVLPVRSVRSSRVIKPNKKFMEDVEEKPKELEKPVAPRPILREARLQLDRVPHSLAEGPFSSPTPKGRANLVSCGVCGAVRFCSTAKQTTKFGIRSCESCRKFIAKVIKTRTVVAKGSMRCIQGAGLCVVRNTEWSSQKLPPCQACWLKLCLKIFLIPQKLKIRLIGLLSPEIRIESALLSRVDSKIFPVTDSRISFDSFVDKPKTKETPKLKRGRKSKKDGKRKGERQRQALVGPRVKHVCRSASVVLGHPLATFPEKTVEERDDDDDDVEKTATAVVTAPSQSSSTLKPLKSASQNVRKKKQTPQPADNLVSMDFWEIYDPDEVCEAGFSLIGSESFSVRALCYLCGSAGLERMIHCACCCEPYHEFCIGEAAFKGEKGTWRWDWICPRCTICAACGRASGHQLTCERCQNSYHTECVGGRLLHSPDRPWVCSACLRCKSCNAADVSVFVGNLPLCKPCFVLRQRGNFCPLCQRCYEDDDYDSKMMECGGCQSWVHAKCEGVSDEKYQVLSFLPESVEFVCRMCCAMPPAPWWLAVEAELKAGYHGVLKALSKNRIACKILKWSSRKICACRRRESVKQTDDDGDGDRSSPVPSVDNYQPEEEIRSSLDENSCLCFLEVDSYNSRSKPFSPDVVRIENKVKNNEYSSLTQFHEDMRSMMETMQSEELMDIYFSAMKEVFPWFDSKASRVLGASRGGSVENTPIKASPMKPVNPSLPCLIPAENLNDRPLEYFYQDSAVQDTRTCLLCKMMGDGASEDTGRLLYCGQNEWVHCNCALWSSEVWEEIDGSLQNVLSAVNRGRGIRCPYCQLKGASVGCCARNCSETYHFSCARSSGCIFLQDKSVFCPLHVAESVGRQLEEEKIFELRRPVYVELDKRKSKPVEASAVRVAVGSLHVTSLGRFVPELSDLPETIIPADYQANRLYWSTREPWRLIQYRLTVRLVEPVQAVGVDLGVNLTVDHSKSDVDAKMRTLRHFQMHLTLPPEPVVVAAPAPAPAPAPVQPVRAKRKRRVPDLIDETENQDLLPPDLEEAILKELSHDILDGISVQDIFQDISEREDGDDDWAVRPRKAATLRTGNWNPKPDKEKNDARWKRKVQEGKENKMVGWCARLLQVDGAIDSSSGSEAGESPGRSVDIPADIPQLDGAADSDYESCDGLVDPEESPVECNKCHCTYRTQRSYERHLESRCHELLLSSSEDDEEPTLLLPPPLPLPPPPPPPQHQQQQQLPVPVTSHSKPMKPRTYTRKRQSGPSIPSAINTNHSHTVAAATTPIVTNPVPVILQEMPYQPLVQYIVDAQKPVIMPNSYQVVLPPNPIMLGGCSPSPMFEVVTDPHTGGMFLAPQQPQPILYNMETIVSNTVMQTNQFMTSSYSHSTSTQVFQASKQVVNMPASYVLAPNDLICVPVTQTLAPPQVSPAWGPMKQPLPKPVPKMNAPAPARPPKPRSRTRPLVDFINNFREDCNDAEAEQTFPKIMTPTPRPKPCYQPSEQPVSIPLRPVLGPIPPPPSPTPTPPPPLRIPSTPMAPTQQLLTISMPSLDSPPLIICDKSPNVPMSLPCLVSPPVPKPVPALVTPPAPNPVLLPLPVAELPPPPQSPPKPVVLSPPAPPPKPDTPPPSPPPVNDEPYGLLSTCDPLPPISSTTTLDIIPPRIIAPPAPVSPLVLEPPRLPTPPPPPIPLQSLNDPVKVPEPVIKLSKEFKITQRTLEAKTPQLVYDVVADDGVTFSSMSLSELWKKIYESVQEVRAAYRMPVVPIATRSFEILGMGNHGIQHLLEQLPGVGYCKKYQPKFFNQMRNIDDDLTPVKENLSGCARSESFAERKEVDKFGWLASRHRKVPRLSDNPDDQISVKKTNHLPMAMRYRALRETKKSELFVYRSKIHGMGLFCTREIESGEMVIEYTGELIRSCLSDKREKFYTDRNIGCYMFRIDDHFVIDATLSGNSARFINHSCEPNCFSRVVDILGRKHIIIFALRRISVMEELTYDYKFPFEDVKISCHCQSKKCRKYLN